MSIQAGRAMKPVAGAVKKQLALACRAGLPLACGQHYYSMMTVIGVSINIPAETACRICGEQH